jgi:copper(I)-binding protein
MALRRWLLAAALATFALPAAAHDYKLGTLEIGNPWTRATPPSAQSGGGFLTITNKGTTPDRLTAVRSAASTTVEIHEMKMDGNVMRMRELEKGVEIAPGATVELKPGGYHIMFMNLKAPFTKDGKIPATLVFEKAGSIDVELDVAALGAGAPQKH